MAVYIGTLSCALITANELKLKHPHGETRNLPRGALDTGGELALAKAQGDYAKATTSSPGCR